jgi:hypothetical protein
MMRQSLPGVPSNVKRIQCFRIPYQNMSEGMVARER